MTAHDKLVQYLEEAHALEGALVQTLSVHIAMTPDGAYRELLERHLQETRDHAQAIGERLGQLGAGRKPFALGLGLIENVIGQAVALGKAPLDLMRGSSGEEKLLKNAKDETASEALEIATYDGIEALAEALGDEATADLARRHREQEERMLAALRELIPSLTEAVVAADVLGIGTYEAGRTGAADAVRSAAQEVRSRAARGAGEARASARRTASRARSSSSSSRGTGGSSRSRSGGGSSSRSSGATARGASGGSTRSRKTSGSSRSRSTGSSGSGSSRTRSASGSSSSGGGSSSGSASNGGGGS